MKENFKNNIEEYYINAGLSIKHFIRSYNMSMVCVDIKNPFNVDDRVDEYKMFFKESSIVLNKFVDDYTDEVLYSTLTDMPLPSGDSKWQANINIVNILKDFKIHADTKPYELMITLQNLFYNIRLNLKMISSYYITEIYKHFHTKKKDHTILESDEFLKWSFRQEIFKNDREISFHRYIFNKLIPSTTQQQNQGN